MNTEVEILIKVKKIQIYFNHQCYENRYIREDLVAVSAPDSKIFESGKT
jgi:hypothetical protein